MSKLMIVAAVIMLCFWLAGSGYGGFGLSMAADTAVSQDNNAKPPAASDLQPGAVDQNGKPMTKEEFAKAYKARMETKSDASIDRLEARQSRWKKKGHREGTE